MAGSGTPGWLDGVGTSAQFSAPVAGFGDMLDNLFIIDADNHRIRKLTSAGLRNISNDIPCIFISEALHDGG